MSTIDGRFSGLEKRHILLGIGDKLKAEGKPHSIFHADVALQTMTDDEARSFIPKGK